MVRVILLLAMLLLAAGIGYAAAADGTGGLTGRLLAFLPFFALALGLVALLAGLFALRRTLSLQTEIRRLSQSIEVSLREFENRSSRDAATISEMNQMVARELKAIDERQSTATPAASNRPAEPPADRDNVVKLPALRRVRPAGDPQGAEAAATEAAFRAAIAQGDFDVSLQPIVSVGRSVAAGFEVFAHLSIDGGPPFDIRRAPEAVEGSDRAAFERRLIVAAAEAARRRVGSISDMLPLHVAASNALLSSPEDVAALHEMLALYPMLGRSLVLSVPLSVAIRHEEFSATLLRLAETGMRIAVEGWPEAAEGTELLRRVGASMVKLPANRLLDRERQRRKLTPASMLIETAAIEEIGLLATDVASDEDVVSLMDIGIDLMSGERFSGPRRLKAETARQAKPSLADATRGGMVNPA